MKLSVIIPVYNVEDYIQPCLESVLKQDLDSSVFEVILVNDGTQDKSIEKIVDIVSARPNIFVIDQSNQGLSVARNVGLQYAKGEYILFIDSDDLLVENSISPLLNILDQYPVDLLVAGFKKMGNDEILSVSTMPFSDTEVQIQSGRNIFLHDFNPRQCYVWRTFYRRNFLEKEGVLFIPGIYFEDVPFTIECYLKAKKCIKVSFPFYIYRQRQNSIVSSMNMKKLMDMNVVLEQLWKMRRKMILSPEEDRQLKNTVFATFSLEVWYLTHEKNLLPYSNDFVKDIKTRIPDLDFTDGAKQRIVSFLFRYFPSLYIRFYSYFLNLLHKQS